MAKKLIPRKTFKSKDDFHNFVENEKAWMYSRIVEAITESFECGKLETCILEAKIEDVGTVLTMNSDIEDWETSLSLAIEWYKNQELYEECSKIQNLIRKIRDYLHT